MPVVIDTSALIAVLTNEPLKTTLVKITTGVDLLAPHSVHWEIGNAFSAMLKRRRLSLRDCKRCLALYATIPIQWIDIELAGALHVAHRFQLYAYDAYLLNCSQITQSPLLTLDDRLQSVAETLGIPVFEVPP